MKIIILNCGSSSIKYQLVDMPEKAVLAKGLVEKIGLNGSRIKHINDMGQETILDSNIADHQTGMEMVFDILVSKENGCVKSLSEVDA